MKARAYLLFAGLLTLLTPRAHAQDTTTGFALNRFDPSERGSEWFVTDSLDFRNKLAVGLVGDYAYKPLVFYKADGSDSKALVRHQLYLHLGASYVFWERLRVGVNLPVAAVVKGSTGVIDGRTYGTDEGGALGDLRLSADARILGKYRGLLSLSAGASLWLPTGSRESYTGDGKVRVAPHVNIAGQASLFVYAGKLSFNFRPQDSTLAGSELGSELFLAGSAGVRVMGGKLVVGPELYSSTVVNGGAFRKRATPVEALLGAHGCVADVVRLGGGVGTGLTEGFGSPKFRALFSVEYTDCAEEKPPEPAPSDRDDDGILDDVDACPDERGVASSDPTKNGCPVRDRDDDGILDDADACPDEAGEANEDPAKNGCPVRDRDADSIPDDVDACPDLKGFASSDPTKNGCPDSDSDGIIDPRDACPNAAGPANEDPEKNGCPAARIEKGQIRILEQVKFKTNSAEILSESDGILSAVLSILEEHGEITRISIEGHTDNVGNPKYNKKLSEKRAASVVKWLLSHGVDKARLTSTGFGQDAPLADNDSEEGRRKNRRVEFHIRELNGKPADQAGEEVE